MSDHRILADRYEVRKLLGRGGMAEVHEGVDTRLGRTVAIKLLRSDLARDPSFHARLRREAQSAAALNHPAIVAVYDSGEQVLRESGDGEVHVPYIVMEYVRGHTLRDMLKEDGPLPVEKAVDATAGVLSALQYSHRAGIVHRDIKPGNVIVTDSGDVKVMDFGIARALADTSATMTQTSAVVGTAQYLSPEQARGEVVDARTDLYSSGCLLYELLTGRPPFVGDSPVSVAYQHVREEPEAPSTFNEDVPEGIDRVLLHALSKERSDRYQDAGTFRADLLAGKDGRTLSIDHPESTPVAAAAPDDAPTQAMAAPTASTTVQQHTPAHRAAAATSTLATAETPSTSEDGGDSSGEPPEKKKKSAKGWIWFLSILLVLVLAGLGFYVYTLQQPDEKPAFKLDNVTHIDAKQAKSILTGRDLKVTQNKEKSKNVSKGNVIATDPKPGATVHAGDLVTLVVSSGRKNVKVPDLAGQTETYARQLIEQNNLKAGTDSEEYSPDMPKGKVLRSDPQSGEKVPGGTTIDLVLSNGKVKVPGVVGEEKDDACDKLESDDYQLTCNVEKTQRDPDTYPSGTVVKQSTKAGNDIEQHSTITITVATEPPDNENTPSPTETSSPTESPTESSDESSGDQQNGNDQKDNGQNGDGQKGNGKNGSGKNSKDQNSGEDLGEKSSNHSDLGTSGA